MGEFIVIFCRPIVNKIPAKIRVISRRLPAAPKFLFSTSAAAAYTAVGEVSPAGQNGGTARVPRGGSPPQILLTGLAKQAFLC